MASVSGSCMSSAPAIRHLLPAPDLKALREDQRGEVGKQLVTNIWNQFESSPEPHEDSRQLIAFAVRNDSDGHGGTKGGETHFAVAVCSESFDSDPKLRLPLSRHRAVMDAASELLAAEGGIHALSIHTARPSKIERLASSAAEAVNKRRAGDASSSSMGGTVADTAGDTGSPGMWSDEALAAAREAAMQAAGLRDVPPCAGGGDGSARKKAERQRREPGSETT